MKSSRDGRVLGGILVAVALAAVACGGGAVQPTQQPGSAAGSTPAGPVTSGAAAGSSRTVVDELSVSAKDFSFSLNLTSLHPGPPGVAVTFKNGGATQHTLTFYSDPDFKTKIPGADSGSIAPGASTDFPFLVPDGATTVYFRCDIHPTQMTGQLPVQ